MLKKMTNAVLMLAVLGSATVPVAASAHDRRWRERDERHYHHRDNYRHRCKRDKGNGGLVIGAIAGGLIGHEVAKDKTAGTIIGAGVGGLGGRAIDRSNGKC